MLWSISQDSTHGLYRSCFIGQSPRYLTGPRLVMTGLFTCTASARLSASGEAPLGRGILAIDEGIAERGGVFAVRELGRGGRSLRGAERNGGRRWQHFASLGS